MGWLGFSGRCNKQQYWIMVAVLFISPMIANIIKLPTEGSEIFWCFLYGRRLHDFGKSMWWALGMILLSLVPVLLLGAITGSSFRDLIVDHGVDDSGHRSSAYLGAIGGAFVIQHGFTVWLGLRKGDEGPNRFGPPQKNWGSPRQAPSGERTIWEARFWEDEEPGAPTMVPGPPKAPSRPSRYAAGATRPVFGRRPSA